MKEYTIEETYNAEFTEPTVFLTSHTTYYAVPLTKKQVKKQYTNVFITKSLRLDESNTVIEGKGYSVYLLRKGILFTKPFDYFNYIEEAEAFAEYIDMYTCTGSYTELSEFYGTLSKDFTYLKEYPYEALKTFQFTVPMVNLLNSRTNTLHIAKYPKALVVKTLSLTFVAKTVYMTGNKSVDEQGEKYCIVSLRSGGVIRIFSKRKDAVSFAEFIEKEPYEGEYDYDTLVQYFRMKHNDWYVKEFGK
jgi:hypothetical protein